MKESMWPREIGVYNLSFWVNAFCRMFQKMSIRLDSIREHANTW